MRLQVIPPEVYARIVLPQSHALWGRGRDLKTYAAHGLEIARSGYGRRHYRTLGLFENGMPVASFKRYERIMQDGAQRLRAFGIGAVFTPPERRGRGYATAMLAAALDTARSDGYDLAYLFSDIRPQFYGAIGFRELPSREISLRADTLPSNRLTVGRLGENDWNGVRRCFDLCARGNLGFGRTPLVWEFIRTRMRHRSEHPSGQDANLVVRHGRGVGAYVLGVRIPERDAYVVDEFGFADESAALAVPTLLRAAAGDLQRIVGWLPPAGARELLPKGSVRKRRSSILMVAPLSPNGTRIASALAQRSNADCCWATDHI